MDVETVGEQECRALLHLLVHMLAVDVGLQLIGGEHHHHVGPFGGVRDFHDLELLALRLLHAGGTLAQRHRHVLDA